MPKAVLVIMGTALALWTWLLLAVLSGSGWLATWDTAVMRAALAGRSPEATAAFRDVTWLGSPVVYLMVLTAGALVARSRGWAYTVLALGSLALAQMLRVAVNLAVHRPRPPHAQWLANADFYAFPSGHTVAAGVGFGLAAWLIWLIDRRLGSGLAVASVVVALLVGWSRVYLGVHWPSDVLGSLLWAVFWLCATIWVARLVLQ